ncbi:MAG: ATP-binding protein [Candidatus Competibacterales bacterium]|nr:ATP-binding protein [Candidatus Competibacterales bacterium]
MNGRPGTGPSSERLLERVDLPRESPDEASWIEVIQKMDEIYADLVHYQVELEQKNAELEQAQRFIASVQAAMSDVLIVCDLRGRVQRVNAALERVTGRTESQLLGQPVSELLSAADRDLGPALVERVRGETVTDCEVALRGPEDEPVPLAVNCSARCDSRGRLVGAVLIGRPVGELRRAYTALNEAHRRLQETQAQLIHSEKMASLGRLVAGVAHELNNPISFVYGNIHSLRRYQQRLQQYLAAVHSDADPQTVQDLRRRLRIDRLLDDLGSLIDGTREGAERVSDIVGQLRQFSASRPGATRRFDLEPVIRTAVRWVCKGESSSVPVTLDLEPELYVSGHAGQLQQVLMNLLQNALDALAGRDDPVVEVRARRLDDGIVEVRVSDNGPGIAPADRSRVFDPFFTTKPVGQGTGLGLSISHTIVDNHGGTLGLDNPSAGGACFRLTLPADPAPETAGD